MTWQLYAIIAVVLAFAVWFWWYAIARFAMRSDLWEWLLRNFIRKIRFTWAYTKMTGKVYRAVRKVIQPGDLIVTIDEKRGSSIGTPGKWAHGAIYCGPKGQVAEMTDEENRPMFADLLDVCFHADHVAVYRCPDWTPEYVRDVIIPNCRLLAGRQYDRQFSLEPEADGTQPVYCFEAWRVVDPEGRLKLKEVTVLGEPAILGESLTQAENAICVFNSQTYLQGA